MILLRTFAHFLFFTSLFSDLTYLTLSVLSLCDSLLDLYQRTYDSKPSRQSILPGSQFFTGLMISLKTSLPTSLLYYFVILLSMHTDTYFTAIECAVKLALIKMASGTLETWILSEVASSAKLQIVEVDAWEVVKKGIMHAGERNRVVQALKIAKNDMKDEKVTSIAK